MATYTEKLGLKMPAQTDFYNVDDFNENFRKIDENTARNDDIQQVLTLADPVRSNRAPTTADAQYAGKLWVVPKMIFNNMMPNALAQVASNWNATAATVSVSGNAATLVGDGTASTIVGEVNMTAVRANDIVYIAAKMTVTADANGAVLELLCGDEVIATTNMSAPVAGNNIRLIGHTKVDTAGALKLRVTTIYNSATAQLGKGVTVSDITILDLTADMCQNFAGIEFSNDAATTYIDTYGNFQTKTYELSEYWWICRGSYGGQYSWQRYDDYTNAKVKEYSDSYQNSKATTAEAEAGTDDTHWMSPKKVKVWWDKFYSTFMLPIDKGGTGLSSAPSMLTDLASTTADSPLQASPRPGVTGTLHVANGGTGKASWVANRIAYPSDTTIMSQLAFPGTAGSVLAQGKSGAPYWRDDIITLLDWLKSLGPNDGETLNITWNLTSGKTNGVAWSSGDYLNMIKAGDFAEYTATISGASATKFLVYMPQTRFVSVGSTYAPTDKATLYIGNTKYELGDNIGGGYDQSCPEIYFVQKFGKVASNSKIKLRFTCKTTTQPSKSASYDSSQTGTIQAYTKGGMS